MAATYSGPPHAIATDRRRPRTFTPPVTGNRDVIAAALADMRRRRRRRQRALRVARVAAVLAVVAAWQVGAMLVKDAFYYPTPVQVGQRLVEWCTVGTPYGSVWRQITATLEETTIGFAVGAATGATAGVLLARTRFLADVCAPLLSVVDAVPRIVLGSLFVILFGLGMSSKIITVVVMVFFAVFFDTFSTVREINPSMLQQAALFGASRRHALTAIVIPVARSGILAALHRAFGLALIGALMGEYIGSDRGLGYLVHNAQAGFDVPGVYAGLVLTTMLALAVKAVLRVLLWLAHF